MVCQITQQGFLVPPPALPHYRAYPQRKLLHDAFSRQLVYRGYLEVRYDRMV